MAHDLVIRGGFIVDGTGAPGRTGDLAFSGKADDYALAAGFFDALTAASGVPKERIFCIPGNHDIDRDRQKLSFLGARTFLQDQNRTDALLAGGEDLETLLERQENYRRFQNSYFTGQDRTPTADGLGYVSRLTIEDVRLAIVGLDSAWLAQGGVEDHGKLLIGERQLINAIEQPIQRGPGFYVMDGEGPRSVGTIQPRAIHQVFYEQGEDNAWNYRLGFFDQQDEYYRLKITDLTWNYYCAFQRTQDRAPAQIASDLTQLLKSKTVHLRIGLSRGWAKFPGRCFLQVNGVYTFPDYLRGKIFTDFTLST